MSKVKISELEETTTVQEGCCFPIVTEGVTKKITYGTLANKLNTIIEPEWDKIKNKPSTYTPSDHTHTTSEITDFPTIPSKTSQLNNDSGFVNETYVNNAIISAIGVALEGSY